MESRANYRTVPGATAPLDVQLIDRAGVSSPVTVEDIAAQGLRVVLPPDFADSPDLGQVLTVRFDAPSLRAPIDAPATVVHVAQSDSVCSIGLQFLDWMGLVAAMPKALAPTFNQRQDPRFELDAAVPVEALVRGPGDANEVRGVLLDLSRSGLSFSASLLSQCAMKRSDVCCVEFQLPDVDRKFSFSCRICSRTLYGESLRYGVLFDRDHTPSFGRQQGALDVWIKGRLEAALRELTR